MHPNQRLCGTFAFHFQQHELTAHELLLTQTTINEDKEEFTENKPGESSQIFGPGH